MSKGNIRVKRIPPAKLDVYMHRLASDEFQNAPTVWSTCRNCGEPIPQSEKHHAYCDTECKKQRMRSEMF